MGCWRLVLDEWESEVARWNGQTYSQWTVIITWDLTRVLCLYNNLVLYIHEEWCPNSPLETVCFVDIMVLICAQTRLCNKYLHIRWPDCKHRSALEGEILVGYLFSRYQLSRYPDWLFQLDWKHWHFDLSSSSIIVTGQWPTTVGSSVKCD